MLQHSLYLVKSVEARAVNVLAHHVVRRVPQTTLLRSSLPDEQFALNPSTEKKSTSAALTATGSWAYVTCQPRAVQLRLRLFPRLRPLAAFASES